MVHREGATDYVSSLGADVMLPLTDGWAQAVHDYTNGRGVDVVVDPVGGPASDDAIRVLATDDKLLVIGFAAGGIPTVKVNRLLLRNVGVLSVAWGEYLNKVPGSAALLAWGLGQLVSLGLKPPPPQRYPLSEGRAALQSLADGGVFGKVVLEPQPVARHGMKDGMKAASSLTAVAAASASTTASKPTASGTTPTSNAIGSPIAFSGLPAKSPSMTY